MGQKHAVDAQTRPKSSSILQPNLDQFYHVNQEIILFYWPVHCWLKLLFREKKSKHDILQL